GFSIFLAAAILSVLLCLQGARRMRERHFLLDAPGAFGSCEGGKEVLRVLADYLTSLWQTNTAILSDGPGGLAVIRGRVAYAVPPESWPLEAVVKQSPPLSAGRPGLMLRAANWLPAGLAFYRPRIGMVAPAHGLVLELHGSEKAPAGLLLLSLRLPF